MQSAWVGRLYDHLATCRSQRALLCLALGLALTALLITATWPPIANPAPDSHAYIAIAEGRLHEVNRPFANRLLHPYLVRGGAGFTNLSLDQTFLIAAAIALAVLVVSILFLGSAFGWQGLLLLPFVTPALLTLFRAYHLPDLFHAALAAAFLLAFGSRPALAVFLLGMLQFTRESTVLLAAVAIGMAVLAGRYRAAGLFTITTVVCASVVHVIASYSPANVHNMSEWLYLALKLPFNAFKNVAGVTVWTNTSDTCQAWMMLSTPPIAAFGDVKAFGLCAWTPTVTVDTLTVLLTLFGIGPTVLAVILVRRPGMLSRMPEMVSVAITYGVVAFLIGPLLGASVERLAAYGWPAFWVGTPVLLSRYVGDGRGLAALPVIHLMVAWAPSLMSADMGARLLLLAGIVCAHFFAAQAVLKSGVTGVAASVGAA